MNELLPIMETTCSHNCGNPANQNGAEFFCSVCEAWRILLLGRIEQNPRESANRIRAELFCSIFFRKVDSARAESAHPYLVGWLEVKENEKYGLSQLVDEHCFTLTLHGLRMQVRH
jgi:hypothetical protein